MARPRFLQLPKEMVDKMNKEFFNENVIYSVYLKPESVERYKTFDIDWYKKNINKDGIGYSENMNANNILKYMTSYMLEKYSAVYTDISWMNKNVNPNDPAIIINGFVSNEYVYFYTIQVYKRKSSDVKTTNDKYYTMNIYRFSLSVLKKLFIDSQYIIKIDQKATKIDFHTNKIANRPSFLQNAISDYDDLVERMYNEDVIDMFEYEEHKTNIERIKKILF
ncbi:MAG: hypothetical protein J6D03_04300 [Clostridia bacterium]|nr:hypothetical protein [Clostridia bacterium]